MIKYREDGRQVKDEIKMIYKWMTLSVISQKSSNFVTLKFHEVAPAFSRARSAFSFTFFLRLILFFFLLMLLVSVKTSNSSSHIF